METAEKEERMAAIVAAQDFLNAIPPSEGRAVMEEIQRFATLSYPVVPTEAHLITFMWEQSQSELVRMLASSALRHAIDTVWGWVNRLSVLCEDPRVTCPGTDGPSEELGPAKKFLKSLDPVWLGMVLDGVHTMTATQPLGPGWAEVVDGLDPWQLKSVVEGGGLSEKERYRLHQRKEAHSNRNLCNLIQRCIGASPIASLSKVCERVLHFCYDDLNGDDDMAIILVAVLPDGWTLADWFNWMKTGGGEP
ncbi:hypothetical protein CALCODRAFT_505156 [Calocera cornea HHB12733]|uniref:Uncharacterized protein n=1 Tax=Calocera cornea HHB12733 TaxID=1353952 RepID=A0A165BZI2_9BASI|nr:hypothetical protein CALCODRAFT_505156 [Calocera cornea HHB12733]